MQYGRENKKTKQTTKTDKQIKLNKRKEEREIKQHTNPDEEQSEICLSCCCSPLDFFLDLSLVFSQPQVLLSYVWEKEKKSLSSQFCRTSWFLQAEGELSSIFPSLWVGKDGGSVWVTIITGAQFPAHTPRALCGLHSPLCTVVPSGSR